MVYISGDIHGDVYRISEMITKHWITEDDIIVLLGDVGMNYYGNKHGDRRRKKMLNSFGIKILCIHGNHEMRPESLITYREDQWHGGTVYVEEEFPNLLFAKDGEVYDLDGRKAIAIGGAYSVDKWYRLRRGLHWFPDEQPSDAIKARVEKKLDELGWQIDTVLTHTCPYRYIPREAFLDGIDQSTVDNSTELWLDSIAEKLDYQDWYCGHWHIEKQIDKMHFLFESVDWLPPKYDLSTARRNPYVRKNVLHIYAGVEGAGKSSILGVFKNIYKDVMETSLTDESDLQYIREKRELGWYIDMLYIGLDTVDEHLARINNRVKKGGSAVNLMEVQEQFENRWTVLKEVLPLCNEVSFYDNTNITCCVATYRNNKMHLCPEGETCIWLREWMYTAQDLQLIEENSSNYKYYRGN